MVLILESIILISVPLSSPDLEDFFRVITIADPYASYLVDLYYYIIQQLFDPCFFWNC